MKYLKLLLIFLVLAGGIFAILNWSSLSPTTRSQQEDNLSEEDKHNISEECKKIRDAWDKETGWNEELYKTQRANIDQSKAMQLFSPTVYDAVDRCLHEIATKRVCEGYKAALNRSPFSEGELKKFYSGVQTVKKLEQMGNDSRIKEIEQIQQLYSAIKSFNSSRHSITPQYNPRTNSWVSFNDQQSKIVNEANALYKNPWFSKVSHIPGFKDVTPENVKKSTEALRHSFYQTLCNQICNQATYDQLYDAKERFGTEYPSLKEKLEDRYYEMGKSLYNN